MSIPNEYKLLYGASDIHRENVRLAKIISAWARDVQARTGRDLLTVPVLRGGLFFFADLVRMIDTSVEVVPGHAQAYEQSSNQLLSDQLRFSLGDLEVRERAVLLVDDICDSGKTLQKLVSEMKSRGAREVKSVVLVHRKVGANITPDWVGFTYLGDEWLVGYGMDDNNKWRNLDSVYIKPKAN